MTTERSTYRPRPGEAKILRCGRQTDPFLRELQSQQIALVEQAVRFSGLDGPPAIVAMYAVPLPEVDECDLRRRIRSLAKDYIAEYRGLQAWRIEALHALGREAARRGL